MNETTASIARNTKAMMMSQVITWISSFVLMSFMPRYLGPEEFGRLYFAITINAIAGLIMDLGLTMLLVKSIARDRNQLSTMLVNGGVLRSLAWTLSLVGTMAFVVLSDYPAKTVNIVFVLALANWFYGMYDIIHRVFNGLERLEYRSICLVIEKVFLAIVGVTVLLMGMGPLAVAVVMLLSMVLNFAVSSYYLKKLANVDFTIEPKQWVPILKQGFPFMVSTTFAFIYYRIDVMMLSSMTNDAVVGWYGAPYRLFDTLMFFPLILTTAVFPVLARLWQTSRENMVDTSRKLLDLTVIVAVPLAVGMSALAQPIISLLFGLQEYWNSIVLLQILSLSLLLVYVDFVFNTVLVSYDKQKQLSLVAISATFLNIGMNFIAIPYFQNVHGNGAIGAALTTAATETFVMGMSIYLLPKGTFNSSNYSLIVKTLFGGALMWGAVWVIREQLPTGFGWIVAGIVGTALYVFALYALRVVSKRELNFLLHLLPLRKRVPATTEAAN